jgi:hypothetical protein
MLQEEAITPVLVKVIDPATPETTVPDFLFSVIGLVGGLLLLMLLLGMLAGGLLVAYRLLVARNPFRAGDQARLNLHSDSSA